MAIASIPEFIAALRRLPLLTPEQKVQLPPLQKRFTDIKSLGKELIRRGWLTRFQANHLANGRGQELILDQYILLDLLGQGGMGAVYKARQCRVKRDVALKLIRPVMLTMPGGLERFQREAESVARLSHPNIVTLHDANEVNGTHFLVMEFIEGTDLAKLVEEQGPLPPPLACDYIRQAALGLQHAHEQGLVHRDIKPHNLLLTKKGVVKILDMGLARLDTGANGTQISHQLTQEGAVMGTPDYLAPEQAIDAHEVDIRADIYSLGCSLYFLLTKQPPFPGGSLTQKVIWHQQAEPRPLIELVPGLPTGLDSVVRKMMVKRPQDRYQTPAEVAAALAPFCGIRPGNVGTAAALSDEQKSLSTPLSQGTQSGASGFEPAASWWRASDPSCPKSETHAIPQGMTVDLNAPTQVPGSAYPPPPFRGPQPVPVPAGLTANRQRRRWPWLVGVGMTLLAALVVVLSLNGLLKSNSSDGSSSSHPVADAVSGGDTAPVPKRVASISRTLLGELRQFKGHAGTVNCVAFSPDGLRVASGGGDKTVRLWDVETGTELYCFQGHTSIVNSVAFSPDGHRILSGSDDGTIRLIDAENKRELRRLEGHTNGVSGVVFTPDGLRAVSGGKNRTVRVWDLAKEKSTGFFNLKDEKVTGSSKSKSEVRISSIVISPDGKYFAVGCEGPSPSVRLCELEGLKEVWSFTDHSDDVTSVAFSPTGDRILSGSRDRTVRLLTTAEGKEIRRFDGHHGRVYSVAFAPDGRHALSAGYDDALHIWALPSSATEKSLDEPIGELRRLRVSSDTIVYSIAISADGRLAVSGDTSSLVRIWGSTSAVGASGGGNAETPESTSPIANQETVVHRRLRPPVDPLRP